MKEEGSIPKRQVRADALRNEDAILLAAKEVFAENGVDAPVRTIAARAGVGVGTLYRRFPKRSDLVTGVFCLEVDACAAEAEKLTNKHSPVDALVRWLQRYTRFLATKKGLAAALHSGDPAFDALPDYFRANFEPVLTSLLAAAAATGEIRDDIAAYELLGAIGSLSAVAASQGLPDSLAMVNLLIDGLRYSAANKVKKTVE